MEIHGYSSDLLKIIFNGVIQILVLFNINMYN